MYNDKENIQSQNEKYWILLNIANTNTSTIQYIWEIMLQNLKIFVEK